MAGDVAIDVRGDVAWIRLERPERYNAYDAAMAHAITAAVRDALDAGVIVITGTGKGFCAGGMLSPDAGLDEHGMRNLYHSSIEMFDAIRMSPRPVIAAVNGAAAGGGNELVIACDLAIAAASATFGQTGPKIGSAPVTGGTNLLAMQVGEKRAKEISFLCRRYSADVALEMGLVNAVVPDEELEAEATRWADELLAMSPRYLEIAKISSNVWWNQARDSFLTGVGMLTQAIGSEDMLEGMRAFSEKRPPRFRDKGNVQ
jgi:enoyl-CoA hydratase/carnithine racemase